jgi:hypothetical protein
MSSVTARVPFLLSCVTNGRTSCHHGFIGIGTDWAGDLDVVGEQLADLCDDHGVMKLVLAWPNSTALAQAVVNAGSVSCVAFPACPTHVPEDFVSGGRKNMQLKASRRVVLQVLVQA